MIKLRLYIIQRRSGTTLYINGVQFLKHQIAINVNVMPHYIRHQKYPKL